MSERLRGVTVWTAFAASMVIALALPSTALADMSIPPGWMSPEFSGEWILWVPLLLLGLIGLGSGVLGVLGLRRIARATAGDASTPAGSAKGSDARG